jgi:hypothetical protein
MRKGFQLEEAAGRRPEDRARLAGLAAQYDSAKGRDGFCGNRSVVRRMMAALLTYDDQILGKVLTRLVLDHSSVDLGSEKGAKGWFEQRVRSTDGHWVPRQLHALDLLILAFDWRLEQRQSPEAATAGTPELAWAWDNGLEVENWREALDWLRGRCSFCAGRGLGEGQIRHALRQCHRGGAQKVRGNMGDLLYGRDYEPAGGCYVCHLPRDFCSRREDQGRGPWIERQDGACSYDRNLLYDGIVGFSTCGVAAYREELLEQIDVYFMDKGEDPPGYYDDEDAVSWLTQPLFVAGVYGSQMVRQLAIWVRASKAFSRHVVPPPASESQGQDQGESEGQGEGEGESGSESESMEAAIRAEFAAAARAIKEQDEAAAAS